MAFYNTRAIVLGAANWREADRLITLFSRDRGKIRAAAYGCRRPRSRLASVSQLFGVVDVQLTEGQQLNTIKNCDHNGFLADFSNDYIALAYASFIAEFVAEIFEEGQPQAEVYDELLKIIPSMRQKNPRVVALAAFFQILEFTGSQPQYESCVRCGKKINGDAYFSFEEGGAVCKKCGHDNLIILYPQSVRTLILKLRKLEWHNMCSFSIQAKDLVAAENIMLKYLELILGKQLKSLAFIKQITQ
ncbi:DNA repair protein RecO [Pectinatus frisingensis]|uniref:DNA repair protein RecO n=1 Tax=Pectinatus frisingensis TaxID=865 RepID=UPI0018C46F03|nr:DNA repair protein RecO [Pectinatus frisingensis]